MHAGKRISVSVSGSYSDQGTGVVDGRFCLNLLDNGGLGILRTRGGAGARAEKSHSCRRRWLLEME